MNNKVKNQVKEKRFEIFIKNNNIWINELEFHSIKTREWESNLVGKFFIYQYSNDNGISFEIKYHTKHEKSYEGIIVTIKNQRDDIIDLQTLMKQRKLLSISERFMNKYTTPSEQFIIEFFDILKEILTIHAKDIIDGTNWEPTPIDWGDLK